MQVSCSSKASFLAAADDSGDVKVSIFSLLRFLFLGLELKWASMYSFSLDFSSVQVDGGTGLLDLELDNEITFIWV